MKKYSLLLLCLSFFFQIGNKLFTSSIRLSQKDETNDKAYELFKKAEFDKALELYNEIKKEHINDYEANYRAGYIYFLKNDLSLSENYLKKAIGHKPEENDPKRCLAIVYYRQDKFQEAAVLFDEIGEEAKAKQLASFGSNTPYKITTDLKKAIIPFITVDPLPRFHMKVNGKEIIVQLDTGGSELILDSDFAEEICAQTYGSSEGVFGGGEKAKVGFGRVRSIKIGDYEIENIPVHILQMGTDSFNGIVGTNILFHFLSTIDYPNKQLILRRRKEKVELIKNLNRFIAIPFWMEGDHYILARGTANKSESLLFFVDTGLGSGAFYFPIRTADKIGMNINKNIIRRLHGGGGMFEYYPAELIEMTLGEAKQKNLNGIIVENDGGLSTRYEYTIDGIISHTFLKNYAVTFDFDNMIITLVN